MDIAKRVALGLLSPLFIILLFVTAFDIGFVRTATHPGTIKRLIAESGIYDTVVPNLLKQAKSVDTPLGNLATSDPAVQQAASLAITPQYVQQQAEAALDNVYQWLDGKVSQPTFKIDLTGPQTKFADSVSQAVLQRLAGLPPCSAAQNLQIAQAGEVDVNNIGCLPRGISAQSAADQVKSNLAGSGFLADANLSADSLKGSSNIPLWDQPNVKNIPKQYQRAKKTPLILSVLTILCGIGIVFLSKTWQHGLRHIGINLLIIGSLMLLFSWGLNRTVSKNIVPKIKVDNAVFQQDVRKLLTDVAQQVDKNYWFFGGLYTVMGAGGIAAAEVFRRKSLQIDSAPVAESAAAQKN